MNEEHEQKIQRILVALDSSPASLAALEAAAELAASFGAELIGLFVEDINLLRLSNLSFTYEVGLFSTTRRQLDAQSLERQLRLQANRARQALALISERAQVNWSFRVTRGVIAVELLAAALEADLVSLGRIGWSPLGRRRLGSTAQTILFQAPRLTLVLQPGHHLGLPLLVFYDGSASAQKALAAAARLGQHRAGQLTVVVLAAEAAAAERLQAEAEAHLQSQGLAARYLWQFGPDVRKLVALTQTEGYRMLVLPSDGSLLNQEAILALLQGTECPVLVVR